MAEPSGFICSQCGHRMDTKDSRATMFLGWPAVRRRRACAKCSWRATTYEITEQVLAASDTRLKRTMPRLRAMQQTLDQLITEYDGAAHDGV